MSISGIGSKTSLNIQALVDMRAQLDDLQRQLGTGRKSNTYAGLGLDRGLTVGLRSQLSAITSYNSSINTLSVRMQLAQTTLTQIDSSVRTVKSSMLSSRFVTNQSGQTNDQTTALGQVDQILGILNTRDGDQYIYSGQSPDQPAVDSLDHIMNGIGTRAGLKQIIAERNQADLGSNGLGRLVIPAPSASPARMVGNGATLAPDQPAILAGANDVSSLISAGGNLVVNGTTVAIAPGAGATAIRDAINTQVAGVTAAINSSNQLVLTSADATTPVDIGAGTSANLLTEIGLSVGITNPTNLLTQGAVANNDTLVLTVGVSPPLTIVFGSGPGQVSTIAQLATALQGLAGGIASVDTTNGNITISALNTTDSIAVTGTATAANFGLTGSAAPTPNTRVSLSEDVAGSVFGLKLAGVTSTLAGANVIGPSGTPPGISADIQANPNPGDQLKVTFNLPDGTTDSVTLVATTVSPAGAGQFTIGATPAATAGNLQAALTAAVSTLAQTSLSAASAIAASHNFFDVDAAHPPLRVSGPPSTATSLVQDAANTVMWYTGEAGSTPARSTAVTRVDSAISVSYGMRANEQGIRAPLENLAVFAAMSFSSTDPNAQGRYAALTQRIGINLDGQQGAQKISDIEAEIAGAQTTMATAKDRHQQTSAALTDLLQTVEGAPQEQVAAELLALQTNLQASLQTTAMLAKTTILNYL